MNGASMMASRNSSPCGSRVRLVSTLKLIVPQSYRCDRMLAQLNPRPGSRLIPGSSGPNSVAMLGPDLSCKTPGASTYFKKTPALVKRLGPNGDTAVSRSALAPQIPTFRRSHSYRQRMARSACFASSDAIVRPAAARFRLRPRRRRPHPFRRRAYRPSREKLASAPRRERAAPRIARARRRRRNQATPRCSGHHHSLPTGRGTQMAAATACRAGPRLPCRTRRPAWQTTVPRLG